MDTLSDSSSSFEDEEIWIGPVNKAYTARIFSADTHITANTRRKTFAGFVETKSLSPTLQKTTDDLSKASIKSEYYTPDATMSKSNSNGTFIDKVAEILEEPDRKTEPKSKSTSVDRHANFQETGHNVRTSCLLMNIEATLVNNTIWNNSAADQIVISDDEHDNDFLRYQGTQVKYEDITVEEILDDSTDDITPEVAKNEISGVVVIPDSPDLPEVDGDSAETTSTSEVGLEFDDTLEDISRFLKYGENYSTDSSAQVNEEVKETKRNVEKTPMQFDKFKIPQIKTSGIPRKIFVTPPTSPAVLKPRNCYDNIISPVSNYINGKSTIQPRKHFFKTPERRAINIAPSATTSKSNDKFKDILSPIQMYLKHSTTCVKNHNVQASVLGANLPHYLFEPVAGGDEIDQMALIIPTVVYKRSSRQRNEVEKEIKLPSNIKALLPHVNEMYMIKHEKRVKKRGENAKAVARKLSNDQDLTVNCSEVDFAEQDISILHKKPYI